jgi:hypothetical protein
LGNETRLHKQVEKEKSLKEVMKSKSETKEQCRRKGNKTEK